MLNKIKYLICNADDFGISDAVTDAIIAAHKYGIITSTTIMANMPGCINAIDKAKYFPNLGIGVHLTLTEGKPLLPTSKCDLLINKYGYFYNSDKQSKNLIYGYKKKKQIECEFERQVEKIIDLGLKPTHLDSHHHIARMPMANDALGRVAKKFGIPAARAEGQCYWTPLTSSIMSKFTCYIKNISIGHKIIYHRANNFKLKTRYSLVLPDRKIHPNFYYPPSIDRITQFMYILKYLPEGINEILFHPAYINTESEIATYSEDFKLAVDSGIREAIAKCGIILIHFGNLIYI